MNVQRNDGIATALTSGASRRRFVRLVGAGAAGALLAAGARTRAGAQPASPAAPPPALAEWVAGWEALDAGRNVAPYAEDGVLVAVPTAETVRGR